MTFALTKARAWGVATEEPLNRRYVQFLELTITAANTDTDLDIGDHVAGSLGTFWDAVDGSEPGDSALKAIRDIVSKADAFLSIHGTGLTGVKTPVAATHTLITKLDSNATAGGNATETLTVTGLLTTDTILGVSIFEKGAGTATNLAIVDYGDASGACTVADALPMTFHGDPGSGAKVRVIVARQSAVVAAGTYIIGIGTVAPNLTFLSGEAPTALKVTLCWVLKDGSSPVGLTATSSSQKAY